MGAENGVEDSDTALDSLQAELFGFGYLIDSFKSKQVRRDDLAAGLEAMTEELRRTGLLELAHLTENTRLRGTQHEIATIKAGLSQSKHVICFKEGKLLHLAV